MTAASPASAARDLASPLVRLGPALLVLALVLSIGIPIAFAAAPALADALGAAGRVALVSSAILSLAVVAVFVHVNAQREGDAARLRLDRIALRAGGVAAIGVLVLFPAQLSVFALAWPPPETALAYFELLQESRWIGLLSLDLLLMVDWVVLLVLWAGLYVALRPAAPRTMLLTLAISLVATLTYFASNTAFEMLSLSAQHAAATTDAERATLLAAGEDALATFEGPWFLASYLLSGLAALLASIVMWRAPGFGRVVGGIGVAYALLQAVPPTMGTLGMVLSLLSLVPMLLWIGLLARALLRKARQGTPAEGRPS